MKDQVSSLKIRNVGELVLGLPLLTIFIQWWEMDNIYHQLDLQTRKKPLKGKNTNLISDKGKSEENKSYWPIKVHWTIAPIFPLTMHVICCKTWNTRGSFLYTSSRMWIMRTEIFSIWSFCAKKSRLDKAPCKSIKIHWIFHNDSRQPSNQPTTHHRCWTYDGSIVLNRVVGAVLSMNKYDHPCWHAYHHPSKPRLRPLKVVSKVVDLECIRDGVKVPRNPLFTFGK